MSDVGHAIHDVALLPELRGNSDARKWNRLFHDSEADSRSGGADGVRGGVGERVLHAGVQFVGEAVQGRKVQLG